MTKLVKLIRWSGLANIAAGLLLTAYWFLFALLMPYSKLTNSLAPLIRDGDYIWINILGVIGAITGLLGLIGIFLRQVEEISGVGIAGFLLGFSGTVMFTGQLMWETFVWPVLFLFDPSVFEFDGLLYSNPLFLGILVVLGTAFGIGLLLFGIATARAGVLPRVPAWEIAIGAPLFSLGALAGPLQVVVRTLGLIFYVIGLVWIGTVMWREER